LPFIGSDPACGSAHLISDASLFFYLFLTWATFSFNLRFVVKKSIKFAQFLAVTTLTLSLCVSRARAAETEPAPVTPPSPGTNRVEETQEMLRAYLQLQEQLHATRIAVEQTRKDSDEASAQSARMLSARLQAIEQALTAQRTQSLEAMQSSNRVMLIVAGTFAGLGFVALLLMAYFQWRTVSRLAEITTTGPVNRAFGTPAPIAALGTGDSPAVVTVGSAEPLNGRLLGAIDRLEKRIHELETHPPSAVHGEATAELDYSKSQPNGDKGETPNAALLLGKGQSLLNLDKPEEALACFEEVLTADPRHAEGLVKKGTALERLRRLNEAVECYDQAITINRNLTIAYLYKGGLFNRMERFGEALECYEQALRTQEKQAVE
jgi:tetratricopeptide (TPR) repeat protein